MDEPEAVLKEIGRGIGLSHGGDRPAAARLFAEIWDTIGGKGGDPLHRCAVAHAMADVQDDVNEELAWDLRALAAADLITDERAAQAGVAIPANGFYPSLHLNLAECYRKLGDPQRARQHLELGRAGAGTLGDDGYAAMIKEALDRLAARLGPG